MGLRVNQCKRKGHVVRRSRRDSELSQKRIAEPNGGSLDEEKKMKRQILIVVALLALAGLTAAGVQAQSSASVRANIPFQFKDADKVMQAGEYTIRQINPGSDVVMLQLATKNGDASVIVRTTVIRTNAHQSALVFNRYGSDYFFSRVAIEGEAYAWQATKSSGERGVARELAMLKTQSETITVALR